MEREKKLFHSNRSVCWKCGSSQEINVERKVSFRSSCDKCGAGLHCCRNCRYHQVNRVNECAIPGTEFVADREKNNFCEEFAPANCEGQLAKKGSGKNFADLFK